MSVFCTAYIVKMALTAVGICYIIMMGFSRVYLGAHTVNQVIYGSLWGTTLAIIFHYQVKPFFLSLPARLYTNSDGSGSRYNVTWKEYATALATSLLFPVTLAWLVVLNFGTRGNFHLFHSMDWHKRLVDSGCSTEDMAWGNVLHERHFSHAGVIALATGAIVG